MSILYAFGERKQKYVIEKESVRGILIDKEGRLLMLTSQKYGDYCLPGGTKEKGENDVDTLVREIREETGYEVDISTLKEFGQGELWKTDDKRKNTDFHQINWYYFFQGKPQWNQKLTDNEKSQGINVIHIYPQDAIVRNRELLPLGSHWIPRKLAVLEQINGVLTTQGELWKK